MGNQQGKQRGHYGRHIDWEHAERPSPPGKPYLAPDSADLPDIIKIRWAKSMSDGGAPIIGYLVEHRRTGSPHWLRASPNLAKETELILTGLEPGWRYQFRVSAENYIGRSDPGELSEPLTVLLQRSAASAPHFNCELQDTIALENETVCIVTHWYAVIESQGDIKDVSPLYLVELRVQVVATPAPKIAWYKDGFELFSSRRTKIVTDNETSTLIIYQAAFEDEGEIKCTATNRAGHAVTKAYLYLEAPPRIRLPRQYEEGLLFEKSETIRLKVTTAGRPLPTVTWFHEGERLLSGGRITITEVEHGSALRIQDACRDDRGEYMVKGSNKIGEDCVTFLVTITDRPSPPGKPRVVMTLGRTVSLSWPLPNDDGGCKIGAYIVEYFRLGWDMWLKAATSRQLQAQLSELIEGSEYKFRIKAENPYGVSDPSEESDVVFIPDPQRGILKPEMKSESWLFPSSDKDEGKRRQPGPEQETDSKKKHWVLEDNAKLLLDSFPDDGNMEEPDSDFIRRRCVLEANARKLLDMPMEILLVEGPPKINALDKPPRRKRIDSRSLSASPSIPEDLDNNAPPVPKRRSKLKGTDQEKAFTTDRLYISPYVSPSSSLGPLSPALLRDDSITHGSSELMLVLYPEEGKSKGGGLSAEHRSEVELSLSEPAVAPPLSLSAPELGSDELYEMPLLRNAVSSTELLHERVMARLYEDAAEEEMHLSQMRKKSFERRSSLRESVPERRSSFRETALERKQSLKEEKQIHSNKGKIRDEMSKKIHSEELENTTRSEIIVSKILISQRKVNEEPTKSIRKEVRLNSEEREQIEFAKVRERLRLKNEINEVKESAVRARPPNLKQQSNMSSQLSSYDGETGSEHYDGEVDDISFEEEELEEEEEEEEEQEEEEDEDEEEEDNYIGREEDIEINVDDEQNLRSNPKSLIPVRPYAPQHGILKKSLGHADLNEPRKIREEDTYHPRSMVPTRGVVKALPGTVGNEEHFGSHVIPTIKINDKSEKTREKVGKGVEENKEMPESLIPVMTQGGNKKSTIFTKMGFGVKKEKNKSIAAVIVNSANPVTTIILPKPILKKRSVRKKDKDKGAQKLSSLAHTENIDQKKKQVRISEPGEPGLAVPKGEDPKLSPLSKARNQRLQRRQQSLEEEEEANRVFIHQYSDIVKEFGAQKKPLPRLYLDIQELEAHADNITVPNGLPNLDETSTVTSDQEERCSEPDICEVDTHIGSLQLKCVRSGMKCLSSLPNLEKSLNDRTYSPNPSALQKLSSEESVRSTLDYLTDVAIFFFACWLYFFKNELYVIPVLILLVYRQLQDTAKEKYKAFRDTVAAKIPSSVAKQIFPNKQSEEKL